MRLLLLAALAVTLGGCDLFSTCPPASFGAECDMEGEWSLVSIDGERVVGVMELESGGDAYLSIESRTSIPFGPLGPWRGPARWSIGLDDEQEDDFRLRYWRAEAELATQTDCPGYVENEPLPAQCRRSATLESVGTFRLDGDDLTLTMRGSPYASTQPGPLLGTLVFER